LREKRYSEEIMRRFGHVASDFDYGLKYLFLENKKGDPLKVLNDFVSDWWKNPEKKLNFRNFDAPVVRVKDGLVKFKSLLNGDTEARFIYVKQPKWRSGNKVAIIMLKHWNADTVKYTRGINFIRRFLLPISSGLFLPGYQEINPAKNKHRQHQTIDANIGLTIRRLWQDVLDLQYFGNWLKEHEGFDEVGLFPYSIGSLKGFLAALFAPDVFDFGVFHFIADDFTEAFMDGVSTQPEATEVRKNISEDKLRKIWSVISPGAYERYLGRLSRVGKNGGFRLVQANYDLVFGEKNVKRFTEKIRSKVPDVDIYEGDFGHNTMGEVENAVSLMMRDLGFIYKHTKLRYF
jgi:hypothetical protein